MSLNVISDNANGHPIITYCVDTTKDIQRSRGANDLCRTPSAPQPNSKINNNSYQSQRSVKNFIKSPFTYSIKRNNTPMSDKADITDTEKRSASSDNVHKNETNIFLKPQFSYTDRTQNHLNNDNDKRVSPKRTRSLRFHNESVKKMNPSPVHLQQSNTSSQNTNQQNTLKVNDNDEDGNKKPSLFKRLSSKLRRSTKKQRKQDDEIREQNEDGLNIEVMKKVFEFMDRNNKGYLTLDDVDVAIEKLEFLKDEIEFPTREKIIESFELYAKIDKSTLHFDEFIQIMRIGIDLNKEDEMAFLFAHFDRNNDGKITREELKSVMIRLFPDEDINDHDIDRMLDEADLDHNGSVDFNEFSILCQLFTNRIEIEKAETRELAQKSFQNWGFIVNINNKKMQTIDLKQAFRMFDKNGDDKISPIELEEVMKYLGLNPTDDEVKKMIEVVDTNCNGYVDYDEFLSMMTQTKIKPRAYEEELKEIFDVFDIDGDGFITADEIRSKMCDLGEDLTDEDVKKMIKAADTNGDGLIDYNEFCRLLNSAKSLK